MKIFTLVTMKTGAQIVLQATTNIGRHSTSDLVLAGKDASRHHARISISNGAVWLEDQRSQNGSYVNDRRISGRVELHAGDKLQFDEEKFELRQSDPDAEKTEARPRRTTAVRDNNPADHEARADDRKRRPGAWVDLELAREGGTALLSREQLDELMRNTLRRGGSSVVNTPQLLVASGKLIGSRIRLMSGESQPSTWSIGSNDETCTIAFPDKGVSALHAKIVHHDGRWRVVDEISSNGTFVNDKRTDSSVLSSGDRIRFGPVVCVLLLPPSVRGTVRHYLAEKIMRTPGAITLAATAVAVLVYLFRAV